MAMRHLIAIVFLSALMTVVRGSPEVSAVTVDNSNAASTFETEPDSYYRRGRQVGYGYPYSNNYLGGGGGYGYGYNSYNNGYYNGGYNSYRNPYYYQQQSWNPYYQSGYRYNQYQSYYPRYNNYQSGYNYNPGFGGGYTSYGVVPTPTRQYGYAK